MPARSGRSNAADPAPIEHDGPPADKVDDRVTLAVSTPLAIGFGVLYLVLLLVLGITSIRKGHWIMFIVGIFIPIFWIIGALMPPTEP